MIAPALQALTAHRQFVVYRLAPSKSRPGKWDKQPIDPNSGKLASAHDSANWLSYDQAKIYAQIFGESHAVGFVITPECKVFCLDIDSCLQLDNQWSRQSHELCEMFAGAAIERSVSGTGLHVWGMYSGDVPPHGCKNEALGIELYTEKRFIALGMAEGARGDVTTDCTQALQRVIASYFPPSVVQTVDQAWTTEPCEKWRGPGDDAELLRRALASKSAAATFGGRASFADLWEANVDALAVAYPDAGARLYDASSADAALAQHLAFWTGKDCERIERLMRKSVLARDKWEREDYLPRTILGAVARQFEVFVDEAIRRREQIEEAMRLGEGSDEIRLAGTLTLDEMLPRFVFIQDGQQVVDLEQPQHVVSLADWKATFKASTTTQEIKGQFNWDGTPKTKIYETATLWEKSPKRQIAHAVTFLAGGKRIVRDPKGREAVNTWNPPEHSTPPGKPSLFLEHVGYLFGDDAPRFLDWLAHIEQRPGELPQFGWLHISDKQGTGRNWIAGVVARLWPGYAAVNFDLSAFFRTGFNDRLSSKIIAVVDEINEGANESKWRNSETMKSLVNEGQRTINPKFGRIREEFNACRWLVFSNHRSALALNETDRRFNVVIREGAPQTPDYYARLYGALKEPGFIAGVAHFLRVRDLSAFNPGAHAVMNAAKETVIAANRSEVDGLLIDVVKYWPVDVIQTAWLGELMGGKVTPAHRHALDRQGIRARKNPVWFGNASCRVYFLRNPEQWEGADATLIVAELAKIPQQLPFGGIRAYLDNLTAA